MPTLRWEGDTLFSDGRTGQLLSPGDEIEVPEEDVDHYLEERSGGWTRIEQPDDAKADGEDFDAEAFVDRTPVGDVADDIRDGRADGHLDTVETVEEETRDRKTVYDAVADRRKKLTHGE